MAVPLAFKFTVVLMLPVPLAAAHVPPMAEQVQVAEVIAAGRVSTTAALVTFDGPLLVTTIV